MAYTTYSDIEADFKDMTFAAGSGNVTREDVAQFIIESDALINAYVGSVYEVPVASGEGLQLLKFYSRCLVAARIKKLLEVKQEKSTDANQNVLSVLLTPSQVIKELEKIRDEDVALAGATLLVSGGEFYSNNVQNDIEPVMTKEEKQW